MADADTVAGPPERASDLTAFQQAILTVLTEEVHYGLAIKRELEAYYGTDVNHGRLGLNLDGLTEMSLIEKSKPDDRTTEDALTDAGHETPAGATRVLFSKYVTDESRTTTLHDRLNTQL